MREGFPKLYALCKFLIGKRFFHSLTEKRYLSNNNNSLSSISESTPAHPMTRLVAQQEFLSPHSCGSCPCSAQLPEETYQ
jgi:hypothetical protein